MKNSQHIMCAWSVAVCSITNMALAVKAPAAPTARVLVSKIDDIRNSSLQYLDVELKVQSQLLKKAKEIRAVVNTAVDETGRNLLEPNQKYNPPFGDFKNIEHFDSNSDSNSADVGFTLSSPLRKVAKIKQLAGEIELYLPQNDPSSVVEVNDLGQHIGKPVASSTLKTSGLTIVIWTKEKFAKTSASKSPEFQAFADVNDVFGEAFGDSRGKSNTIVVHVKDPQERFVGLGFKDSQGKPIDTKSNSGDSVGYTKDILYIFEFSKQLPSDARIRLYIATPKSLAKVPFQFKDLPLP